MIPTLFAVSIVTFVIIQLPPGDFFTTYISNLAAMGESVDQTVVERHQEGLRPRPAGLRAVRQVDHQHRHQGDFGRSFQRARR